jgi:hypothetical protein
MNEWWNKKYDFQPIQLLNVAQTDEAAQSEEEPKETPEQPDAEDVVQAEPEGIDQVVEAENLTSENVHGGKEATGDIPYSINPKEGGVDSKNQLETQDANTPINAKPSTSTYIHQNRFNVVPPEGTLDFRCFAKKIERTIQALSDNELPDKVAGFDCLDKRGIAISLVKREEWKIPFQTYSKKKDNLAFLLDFSGSCEDYSSLFGTIAGLSLIYGARVFLGYNGGVSAELPKPDRQLTFNESFELVRKTLLFEEVNEERKERNCETLIKEEKLNKLVVLGDFDGGAGYVEASRNTKCKLYWLSNEGRYNDLNEHSWCEEYTLSDFKGKYLPVTDLLMMQRALEKCR